MPIETNCPGCSRVLRVGDEYAGRQARCPICSTIYIVPDGAAAASSPLPVQAPRWYMKTPEQQVYGPVSEDELHRWLNQGRISAECQLRPEDQAEWRPATEHFGVLSGRRERSVPHANSAPTANPFAEGGSTAGWSGSAAGTGPNWGSAPQTSGAPHRGVLILILGIFGWSFSCPLLGIIAWVMGSSDLREMECGRMDPSGRGLTQAGRILGMVQTLLCLAVLFLGFIGILLSLVG